MRRRTLLGAAATAAAVPLAGCWSFFQRGSYSSGVGVACSGSNEPGRIAHDCRRFDGVRGRYFHADAGATIAVEYSLDVAAGRVRVLLRDPEETPLWERSHGDGTHDGSTTVEAPASGRYEVRVEGQEVEGRYAVTWSVSG